MAHKAQDVLFFGLFHFEIAQHQSAGKKWWPYKISNTSRKFFLKKIKNFLQPQEYCTE
jgi:hypothetical protein